MPDAGTVYKFTVTSQTSLVHGLFNTNESLNVYPNPGNGLLTLTLPSGFRQGGNIKLLDLEGRVIKNQSYTGNEMYQMKFDAHDVLPGVYILTLIQEQKVFTQRIVIQ